MTEKGGYGSGKYKVESLSEYKPLKDVKRIFTNFGSTIAELRILKDRNEYSILNLLRSHCVGRDRNLKSLTIRWSQIFTIEMKPIFNRLHTLHLENVQLKDDTLLFAGLDSLVELKIACVKNCRSILDNSFPKLETFLYKKQNLVMTIGANSAYHSNYEQSFDCVSRFISRHKLLKSLKLRFYGCDDNCQMSVAQFIADSCKDLDLRIGWFTAASLQHLHSLNSLKALKLRDMLIDDFKFVPSLAALRELSLVECTLPGNSNQFATLAKITKLELKGSSKKKWST